MTRLFDKTNFIWLTIALVGMMISGAASQDFPGILTLRVMEVSSVALLFLSLISLRSDAAWGRRFVLLAVVILAVVIARAITELFYFEYFYLGLVLLFMLLAAWMVGKRVLLTGEVDFNVLSGSVALYLLLGLIWSQAYIILLEFSPDALKGFEVLNWYENLPSTTYFSFVTLTTLGYGDITPVTPLARVLVILEAICGMFYLAVIVAGLVGASRNKQQHGGPSSNSSNEPLKQNENP